MEIRVFIADDEPLAREKLRSFLQKDKDVIIVGECSSGSEAIQAIADLRPDLLFLDIHLQDLNGFDIQQAIASLESSYQPRIIFVTAYDQYAIKAFESAAFDYLLKPYTKERLGATLARVRQATENESTLEIGQRVIQLLTTIEPKKTYISRLIFKSQGRFVFLPVREIQYISSEGNYVRVQANGTAHLLRETMGEIEKKLDPDSFIRIHRATIVNLRFVKEICASVKDGESVVILRDGSELTLSRSYRQRMSEMITS